MSTRFFLVSLFVVVGKFSLGQIYETSRYADDNGLPSRIVHDVIQDNEGFIWVGGNNGLFKFDGKKFKPYRANLKDTIGLRSNRINVLIQSTDGNIWIGTPMGLHVMEDGKIKHLGLVENPNEQQRYILSIFEDRQQRIWVGTYNGVFLIEPDTAPIHFLKEEQGKNITGGAIWHISQDSLGRIWVLTNDGPYIKNTGTYSFAPIPLEFDENFQLGEYKFLKSRHINDTIVFLGTSKGLLKGVLTKENRLRIAHLKDAAMQKVGDDYIDDFLMARDSSIFLATWKNGLKKIAVQDNVYEEVAIVSRNGLLEMSGEVKSVFEDRQGNIWVANTNGLYKLSVPRTEILTFPPRYGAKCLEDFYGIYAMVQDQKGYVWVTTPWTLYRFSKEDLFSGNCPEEYLHYTDEHMFRARDLFIDSQNRLWVSATEGLFVTQLDAEQNLGEFIRYTTTDGLPHNWCFKMEQIDENNYWLGNYAGFVKMTLADGTHKNVKFKTHVHDEKTPESLVNSQVMDVEYDKNGDVWVGTFSGVGRLVSEFGEGTFENFSSSFGKFSSLSNNSIKKIFSDSKGNLWVATQRGLNRHDFKEKEFQQFGHAEGLPSEYVLGLAEDSKGFLWICTTNGVLKARYDMAEKKLIPQRHYTSKDGLVDNIPYRNSIFITGEDDVVIGSRDGISIIKSSAEEGIVAADVDLALTGFGKIGNKAEGFTSVLDKLGQNSISLAYQENSIQIEYAALDFVKPEFTTYRHKVLPNNETWIQTGNNSQLAYYNLSPGEYEFILDGSNSLGQWSRDPIRLWVTVKPPFWKSNGAYLGYLVVFLGGVGLIYRARIRKKERELEKNMALEAAIVNEREQLRKENAADFHDELGSMVTKISMFLTMAERNFEEGKNPVPFFYKIRENIKGLSSGFRDLLWVIDPQKDSLADTFLRLKEFGEDLFEPSRIDFKTSRFEEMFIERNLNPKTKKQLMMIFKEAMTNCLKHSDGDEAHMMLKTNGAFFKMEFSDNGSGFDVDKKSKGRGVKNMRARAESIGALFSITSSSKGTVVLLDRIPHMGDVFSEGQT